MNKKSKRDPRPSLRVVVGELKRQLRKRPRMTSAHEAIGKLREEYLELEREVFRKERKRDYAKMEAEAAQIAVAAIAFMMDICGDD